jgi:biotin carboxyl carrier protein
MSRLAVNIDGRRFEIEVNLLQRHGLELTVAVDGEEVKASVPSLDGPEQMEWIMVDGRPYEIVIDPDLRWIKAYSGLHRLEIQDLEAAIRRPSSGDGRVKAPIPGLVTQVLVKQGDQVAAGQSILVLEAMKMENEIMAPISGVLSALHVRPGKSVVLNEILAEIT